MTIHDAWTKDTARRVETVGDLLALAVERIREVEEDPLLVNGKRDDARSLRKQLEERVKDVGGLLTKLRGGPAEITESVDEELAEKVSSRSGRIPAEVGS